MTSTDLFLLIATLALIFTAAFLCVALYWMILILRIWHRLSADAEHNITNIAERFNEAIHAIASVRTIVDIGMQTVQTALSAYRAKASPKRKKASPEKENE